MVWGRKGSWELQRGGGCPGCRERQEGVECIGIHVRRRLLQSHWLRKPARLIFVSNCNQQDANTGVLEVPGLCWDRGLKTLPLLLETKQASNAGKTAGLRDLRTIPGAWGERPFILYGVRL